MSTTFVDNPTATELYAKLEEIEKKLIVWCDSIDPEGDIVDANFGRELLLESYSIKNLLSKVRGETK